MDRPPLDPALPSQPRYPGEDIRPTSSKELSGWYLYGFAGEVFVVCGIGSFVPITLEQLARENGVLLSDRSTPCKANLDVGLPPGMNTTSVPSAFSLAPDRRGHQCIVNLLGWELNTASFAMYTFSISVLIQSLLLISMSAFADHGSFRKTLLLTFAFVGSVSTMLFLPVTANVYVFGAFLAIIANTCIGASFVLLNSFLPLLVRHHPQLKTTAILSSVHLESEDELPPPELYADDEDEDNTVHQMVDSTSALLNGDAPAQTRPNPKSPSTASPDLQLSTKISSNGMGIGYIAAVIVQILSVLIVKATGGSLFSLRLVLFFVGGWWFAFTIPAALWLRPRPGPPLLAAGEKRTRLAYMGYAWRSLGRTIMHARRLKDVLLFLAAWFLLSDGIATVSGTAVLFAKTTLGMKPAALAMINVVVMLFGVIGAFTWSRASRWMGLRPSQTILACLCVFELIPLYALLGYIPAIQRLGVFGLQQPWEMFILGAVYGIVLGGLSSYCRALFSELAPPGFEAAFFALYAITDKGSSIFGPAIVGAITDATGDIRPAFWFLAVLIGLPFPLMFLVNVERGKREGEALARELEGRDVPHSQRSASMET